jgi:hypothetical protein
MEDFTTTLIKGGSKIIEKGVITRLTNTLGDASMASTVLVENKGSKLRIEQLYLRKGKVALLVLLAYREGAPIEGLSLDQAAKLLEKRIDQVLATSEPAQP